MEINNNIKNIQFTSNHGNIENVMIKDMKTIVNDFFKEARLNISQENDYEPLSCEFLDPYNKNKYILNIKKLSDDNSENNNMLELIYPYNNGKSKCSVALEIGSKQEILDYLGNENNIPKINYYIFNLKESVDMDD